MIKKIKNIKKYIPEDYQSIIGHLSFSIIVSFPPLLLITSYILSKINLLTFLEKETNKLLIPDEFKETIINFFEPQKLAGGSIVLIIIAILISSNAFNSLIKTANKIYNVTSTNLKMRIKSIMFVPILLIVVFTNFIFIGLSDLIFRFIGQILYYESLIKYFSMFQQLLKIPFSFVIIFLGIYGLFKFLPSINILKSKAIIGSLVTTMLVVIISNLFSFYINNIARYDILYGTISNLIVMIIWINLISYSILIGIIINSKIYNKTEERHEGDKKID